MDMVGAIRQGFNRGILEKEEDEEEGEEEEEEEEEEELKKILKFLN